jgi:hypothetical protein
MSRERVEVVREHIAEPSSYRRNFSQVRSCRARFSKARLTSMEADWETRDFH